MPSSCHWLVQTPEFQHWEEGNGGSPKYFWPSGSPGSGKSVLVEFVTNHLLSENRDCDYFFFFHGDRNKLKLNQFLRSIVCEMASKDPEVWKTLLEASQEVETDLRCSIYLAECVFELIIFHKTFATPHFWIVDGLDECTEFSNLFPLLAKIGDFPPFRIFITSRPVPEIALQFELLGACSHKITFNDTTLDIKLYLTAAIPVLSVHNSQSATELNNRPSTRANGYFLWAHLVLQALETVYTEEAIEEIMDELTAGMQGLYFRIFQSMSQMTLTKPITKAILTWVSYVEELNEALTFDLGDRLISVEKTIASLCGSLTYIDANKVVQLVYDTVKSFILRGSFDSEFTIDEKEANGRLATACLEYLMETS